MLHFILNTYRERQPLIVGEYAYFGDRLSGSATYDLCDLRQLTETLCASASSSVKIAGHLEPTLCPYED